jgi:hypothetical protein
LRNKKRHIANVALRSLRATAALKRRVRDYLLGHPCVDCGESDTEVLDFDHLRDKTSDVSTLIQSSVSWKTLAEEIAKCEVRCANCHRRRTARTGNYYRALATIARIDTLTP